MIVSPFRDRKMWIPKNIRMSLVPTLIQILLLVSITFAQESRTSPTWDVYFSPPGGATFVVQQALDNARLRAKSAVHCSGNGRQE